MGEGTIDPSEPLAGCSTFASFQHALALKDPAALSTRDVSALHRSLDELPGAAAQRVAYLANFSLPPLHEYVGVTAAAQSLRIEPYVGGYDQYMQEVLREDGSLAGFRPDVVTLFLALERLRPDEVRRFPSLPKPRRLGLRAEILEHIDGWLQAAKERLPGTFLVSNFVSSPRPSLGVADAKEAYGEREFRLELNLELLRLLRDEPRAHLFDLDRLTAHYGAEAAEDPRMRYLAKMEWSFRFLPRLAAELVRHLRAIAGRARKCLVLDLDGTLWGGVVGEDGPDGIRVGPGEPVSEAFLDVQHRIKGLQAGGVLLAVCSKNNREDVLEAFQHRTEMPIRLEDFAAAEINWRPKHENLREIAHTLNIGLDSLVFVDDNPAEIELVRRLLPEVHTLLLPSDPAAGLAALDGLAEFEKVQVLEEDVGKTLMYRQNREREVHRSAVGELDDYLRSLETVVALSEVAKVDLPRVHQLFSKTNQFNLTTRRYTLAELECLLAEGGCVLVKAAAGDRFGDLGTIGAYLLRPEGEELMIDSFLMSCRAMGRHVERAMMNDLKARFLALDRFRRLRGRFVPTGRNRPAEGFLEEEGFRPLGRGSGNEDEENGRDFLLRREDVAERPCPWIEVV